MHAGIEKGKKKIVFLVCNKVSSSLELAAAATPAGKLYKVR